MFDTAPIDILNLSRNSRWDKPRSFSLMRFIFSSNSRSLRVAIYRRQWLHSWLTETMTFLSISFLSLLIHHSSLFRFRWMTSCNQSITRYSCQSLQSSNLRRWRFLSMFTLIRSSNTVGTEKMRSHSEPRGDNKGGVWNQQNSLGGTEECSETEVSLYLLYLSNTFIYEQNGTKSAF